MKKIRNKIVPAILAAMMCLMLPGTMLVSHAQTLGEKMQDAAYVVLLGIGTVFLMLVVIALIIYAFRIIPKLQSLFAGKKESPADRKAVSAPSSVPSEPVSTDLTDDLELVAVIAAAIAAYEQIPPDSFRVRTIKRRK
ncbi:MAG: OadG family protein [Agathobacter sp.]